MVRRARKYGGPGRERHLEHALLGAARSDRRRARRLRLRAPLGGDRRGRRPPRHLQGVGGRHLADRRHHGGRAVRAAVHVPEEDGVLAHDGPRRPGPGARHRHRAHRRPDDRRPPRQADRLRPGLAVPREQRRSAAARPRVTGRRSTRGSRRRSAASTSRCTRPRCTTSSRRSCCWGCSCGSGRRCGARASWCSCSRLVRNDARDHRLPAGRQALLRPHGEPVHVARWWSLVCLYLLAATGARRLDSCARGPPRAPPERDLRMRRVSKNGYLPAFRRLSVVSNPTPKALRWHDVGARRYQSAGS